MSFSIIAAIGKNNELGKNNDLIWHLPNDLKFFKEVTSGHTIVMGKKTFLSLPGILPNRKHIVITSGGLYPDAVSVYTNIDELINDYKESSEEVFIIGGASIYKALINYCDKLYLTEINASAEADAYFPEFDKNDYISEILKSNEDNGISYNHILYRKK